MKAIFLFYLLPLIIYSQNTVDNYVNVSYSFVPNLEEMTSSKEQIDEKINDVSLKNVLNESIAILNEYKGLITFELIANRNQCVFFRNKIMIPDNVEGMNKTILKIMHDRFFFTDLTSNEMFEFVSFLGEDYLIQSYQSNIDWEVTTESKMIDGFLAYKAIGHDKVKNKKVIVWFSAQINFNFGPDYTSGLPGLILEYNLEKYSLVCSRIRFDLKKDMIDKISKPNGKVISQDDFNLIVSKAKEKIRN